MEITVQNTKIDIGELTESVNLEEIKEAIAVGAVYGHKKSKTHPRMKPYIVANRNEIEVISPQATVVSLRQTIARLKEIYRSGGSVLLVATKPAIREIVKRFSAEFGFPCVINRWLGGALTNFKVIRKRIEYYLSLKAQWDSGNFEEKYTKKEKGLINQEIMKLAEKFDGLENYSRLPDLVFVVGVNDHLTAVREARRLKIPLAAVVDTDADPDLIDYPIFANDNSRQSLEWLINKITAALKNDT